MRRRDRAADAPGGHGDLGQASQRRGLSQTHKRDERLFQEIHLADQNVGGFCITRNLLHEFIFQLWERRRSVATRRARAPTVCQEASHSPRTRVSVFPRIPRNPPSPLLRRHVSVEWWVLRLKYPLNLLMQLSESTQEARGFTLTC